MMECIEKKVNSETEKIGCRYHDFDISCNVNEGVTLRTTYSESI